MSIQLKVADYCQNCDEFIPKKEISCVQCFNPLDGLTTISETTVHCEHANRCRSIYGFLKDQHGKETP